MIFTLGTEQMKAYKNPPSRVYSCSGREQQENIFKSPFYPRKFKICRMWESTNTRRNGELISLDMVLVDQEDTLMGGTIKRNLVSKFKQLLKEGVVYDISNFKVVANSGTYRAVDSKFKLLFTLLTTVKQMNDVPHIPKNNFQFVGEEVITNRIENDNILTDIVGCLTEVGDVETVSGGFRKRDLEIISDFSSKTCKVTLWGEVGERFKDEHKFDQEKGPFVIVFTSMRIKKYLGVLSFSTTSATKVYVNFEHPYVSSLIERFARVCPRVKFLESVGVIRKTVEDEMFENRMTIEQLMRAEWLNESKGYTITIIGVIDNIDTQYGWYYLGCKGCCKKIHPIEGVYKCDSCNIQSDTPLTLYKLRLVVRDETGVTTCVVLHRLAERIIDSSALKLFNKYDSNADAFPREITDLCGKKLIFKLQLTDYNLKCGSDVFSVYNVFDPNDSLEEKYKSMVSVKASASNNATSSTNFMEKAAKIDISKINDVGDNLGSQPSKAMDRKRKRVVLSDEDEDE